MVRVHYDGGGRYRTSGHLFEEDDVVDVDEQLADYLCEKDAFARVDGDEPAGELGTGDADADEADTTDGFDVDEWIDDLHYQAREEKVRDGDVDDHLDAIHDAESSTTVQDAVDERRAELED